MTWWIDLIGSLQLSQNSKQNAKIGSQVKHLRADIKGAILDPNENVFEPLSYDLPHGIDILLLGLVPFMYAYCSFR